MATTQTVERLVAVGGREWQKNSMHRVYFNDLPDWYGLKTSHYNTGNISGASLDGETISNSRARDIIHNLYDAKLWYDVTDQKFYGRGISQEALDRIIAAIKRAVQSCDHREMLPEENMVCRRCGQIGSTGGYPFSTAPSTGLCDDCL